jgi:hypothetical protein
MLGKRLLEEATQEEKIIANYLLEYETVFTLHWKGSEQLETVRFVRKL